LISVCGVFINIAIIQIQIIIVFFFFFNQFTYLSYQPQLLEYLEFDQFFGQQ